MSFFEELATKALNDEYLKLLMYKGETICGKTIFGYDEIELFTKKEYYDFLRFADILSRSKEAKPRNMALKIISLLYEVDKYKNDDDFHKFSASVLTKLGNFPSLNLVNTNNFEINDDEIKMDDIVKRIMQSAPNSNYTFTDAQYKLFQALKNSNHYSFSGSTSFGKSFIFESFINHIIEERNASDNIAILVPTRALINQVCIKLKSEIKCKRYKVISHPKVPFLYKSEGNRFILVMTAERLITYFAESNNPPIDYLFIDEAHKLLNSKDPRTPLLYHALMQAKRKSVKLYFASPNLPNTEVFLQLLGNSTEENRAIKESPVVQNRFFIDCIEKKAWMFSDYGEDIPFNNLRYSGNRADKLFEVVTKLGSKNQNIIYCNTIQHTIELARGFSNKLSANPSEKLLNLIRLIEETVHNQYFLIDCLKKGVAFYFGKIPQQIRERIEYLFRNGEIHFLLCTSTLLEGVNLPAKNIFILSKKIGMSNMSDIDFWNLAGRAGRLAQDISGNIVCVRIFNQRGYWESPEEIEILKTKEISTVESPLMKRRDGNLYKNISNSLTGQPLTNKSLSEAEKKSIAIYGNILLYHDIVKSDSILRNRFLKKNKNGSETLEKIVSDINIPDYIIAQSANISIFIQNKIFLKRQMKELPNTVDYESCLEVLHIMYDCYEWGADESNGLRPLIENRNQLKYFATLISYWVSSKPLSYIILNSIEYYDNHNKKIRITGNQLEEFDKNNATHINKLINNLISDIENVIRFKLKNYVNNYILLLKEKGYTVNSNWSDYLEYGTADKFIIEIQNIGFPRHLATFLKDNYSYCFTFENDEIVEFNDNYLKEQIDKEKYKDEFEELSELLGWISE